MSFKIMSSFCLFSFFSFSGELPFSCSLCTAHSVHKLPQPLYIYTGVICVNLYSLLTQVAELKETRWDVWEAHCST